MMTRLISRGVHGLSVATRGLATFIGTFGVIGIVLEGVRATWQHSKDPWLGLLFIVCAGYVGYVGIMAVGGLIRGQDESARRYAELYAAATQLEDAGQALLGVMAGGSRGEVVSAELRWHRALDALEAIRRPPPPPGSS